MKIATIGLSGSGKSYIASILESFGFYWIRSDFIRKSLFGSFYDEETTKKVYEELINIAKAHKDAVLDATFLKKWQRKLVIDNFPNEYFFIFVKADENLIKQRLQTRKDISDADFTVYLMQKSSFEPPDEIPKDRLLILENNDATNIENVLKDAITKLKT
ncbi:AAA family ATPase [Hydrogenobaculum acidophilum]